MNKNNLIYFMSRNKISPKVHTFLKKYIYLNMISVTLSTFASLLSEHLKLSFNLNESIVCVQSLQEANKTTTNKIHIFLVNIERETSGGLKFNQQAISNTHYKKSLPAWQLNLYVVLAAAFSEKQYEESLQLISEMLLFLQSNNQFTLPQTNISLTTEPVNLSIQELSNLWSIFGGTYYPSILCKIRMLNINSNDIKQLTPAVSQHEPKTNIKH